MRKSALLFVFGILTFSVFAQKPDPDFIDKIARQEKSSQLKKAAFIESKSYTNTDVVYHRMELEIDPDSLYIKGVITTYFKSATPDLNEIEFDLLSIMTVDSVVLHQQKIDFTQAENKLKIPLTTPLNEGQLDSVSVFYQGNPGSSGFGSFSQTFHNEVPNIWTLSEPYGAMEWWPCKQSLADKIDSIDIIVTSPEQYRTASLGILVDEKVENNFRKMHWKHRFPVATYLVAVSVTNYVDYSDSLKLNDGRFIEILNYVYPENLQNAKTKTPVTAELIALFNNLIGEYPFAKEKYGHAQFGWGGGMEHQTMSFMYNFNFELLAHELAHQWFGDYITTGSWQDIWLNEGFATYLAGLSYEHLLDGVWWPRWKKLNVDRIISQPGGSVFVSDTTNIGAIFSGRLSYSKGAYILHMLRWLMGDDAFYTGMRNYFNDPEVANGFARTSQFVTHMENAADTILSGFFNDWFYGQGYPIYSAQFSPTVSNEVKITLSQTTSHSSVDFFEMPVPIRVYNSSKTDSANFKLIHTQNNQEFIVNPGFKVAELKIDPDYWLVSKTDEIVHVPLYSYTNEIIVYPNPFDTKISVLVPANHQFIKARIFTIDGKLMQQLNADQNDYNLSELSGGTYLIQVETNKNTLMQKIIKR